MNEVDIEKIVKALKKMGTIKKYKRK